MEHDNSITAQLWRQLWACVALLRRELEDKPDQLCWYREQQILSVQRLDKPANNHIQQLPQGVSKDHTEKLIATAIKNSKGVTNINTVQTGKPISTDSSTIKPSIDVDQSSYRDLNWEDAILLCQACNLGKEATRIRKQSILGYPQQTKTQKIERVSLLLVCDVPNYDADCHNLPMPTDHLAYLKKWLEAIQMLDSYYLTNLVKCRTPGNRAAWPEEVKSCSMHLQKQVAIFQPKAILALGSSSARNLSAQRSDLNTLRNRELYCWFPNQKIPLFVTYSVAEVLHDPAQLRAPVWQDLKKLRAYLQQNND